MHAEKTRTKYQKSLVIGKQRKQDFSKISSVNKVSDNDDVRSIKYENLEYFMTCSRGAKIFENTPKMKISSRLRPL